MNDPGSEARCAVIAAGLDGGALIAGMALQGYRMRLHDLDDAHLQDLRERGGKLVRAATVLGYPGTEGPL